MNKALELAIKLNQAILDDPLIKRYQHLESLVYDQIKVLDLQLRKTQKLLALSMGSEDYHIHKNEYTKIKDELENNPLFNEFYQIQEEVNNYLKQLENLISFDL